MRIGHGSPKTGSPKFDGNPKNGRTGSSGNGRSMSAKNGMPASGSCSGRGSPTSQETIEGGFEPHLLQRADEEFLENLNRMRRDGNGSVDIGKGRVEFDSLLSGSVQKLKNNMNRSRRQFQ